MLPGHVAFRRARHLGSFCFAQSLRICAAVFSLQCSAADVRRIAATVLLHFTSAFCMQCIESNPGGSNCGNGTICSRIGGAHHLRFDRNLVFRFGAEPNQTKGRFSRFGEPNLGLVRPNSVRIEYGRTRFGRFGRRTWCWAAPTACIAQHHIK